MVRWFGERNPATLGTLRNAAHVFAATPATRERCLALGVSADRLSLCQAIALSKEEFDILSSFPFVENPVFFGMGLLIHRKRFDLAIRAFAEASIPDSRLVLIGGGPEEAKLRDLAVKLHIGERVEITGFLSRADAWRKMSECAVMLHPCDLESGGCAVQEALAAGRPVVALDMGGPALMVDDSVGALVSSGSSDLISTSMASDMKRLSIASLRHDMSTICRARVQVRALWTKKGNQYVGKLAEIVRGV
jgi:glycosyltransferase involved in cell wall biosynthesis